MTHHVRHCNCTLSQPRYFSSFVKVHMLANIVVVLQLAGNQVKNMRCDAKNHLSVIFSLQLFQLTIFLPKAKTDINRKADVD